LRLAGSAQHGLPPLGSPMVAVGPPGRRRRPRDGRADVRHAGADVRHAPADGGADLRDARADLQHAGAERAADLRHGGAERAADLRHAGAEPRAVARGLRAADAARDGRADAHEAARDGRADRDAAAVGQAVAPYSREMAVAPVAGRADDRPVDLPRDPRALRYALGGPQGSFERAFDGSKSASALAPPPRPPEPPSPLARTAGLALERRPRTGSPPPMRKFRNPVYPAGSTFGRT